MGVTNQENCSQTMIVLTPTESKCMPQLSIFSPSPLSLFPEPFPPHAFLSLPHLAHLTKSDLGQTTPWTGQRRAPRHGHRDGRHARPPRSQPSTRLARAAAAVSPAEGSKCCASAPITPLDMRLFPDPWSSHRTYQVVPFVLLLRFVLSSVRWFWCVMNMFVFVDLGPSWIRSAEERFSV
jgi:hypothetical protein